MSTVKQEKSEVIEQEISGLQARRQEIATELATALADLATKRDGLVSGANGTGEVTTAQATYTALSEALSTLDSRIEAAGERLKAAQEQEAATGRVARLAEIEKKRASLVTEYAAAKKEAGEALLSPVSRMVAAEAEWLRLSREAQNLMVQQGRPVTDPSTMRYFPRTPTEQEFEEAVYLAYRIRVNAEDRRQTDERRAKFAERTANAPAGDAYSTGDAAESLKALRN